MGRGGAGGGGNQGCLSVGKIQPPESAFEKAFYAFGKKSIYWLEYEAKRRGVHIHHQLCGYGKERVIAGYPVDGDCLETKTVFQFYGCHTHGCSKCFPKPEQRKEVVIFEQVHNKNRGLTRDEVCERTLQIRKAILDAGYNLVELWNHQATKKWPVDFPQKTKQNLPACDSFLY